MHHPLLHKAVLGLMQRLFVLLLEEMGKLGARVVAADFNSVLIYTGKRNITAAGALPGWWGAFSGDGLPA